MTYNDDPIREYMLALLYSHPRRRRRTDKHSQASLTAAIFSIEIHLKQRKLGFKYSYIGFHKEDTTAAKEPQLSSPEVEGSLGLPKPRTGHARQSGLVEQLEAVEHVRRLAGRFSSVDRCLGEINLRERVKRSLRLLARNAFHTVWVSHFIATEPRRYSLLVLQKEVCDERK